MLFFIFAAVSLVPIIRATPFPSRLQHDYHHYFKGFKNPAVETSVGGKAICIGGTIEVTTSALNTKILLENIANQTVLTELVQEVTQINSTIIERLDGGRTNITGTYGMYSQLCFPRVSGTINTTSLQFLVHGGHFGREYWNIAPGNSYVDYAAEQGCTTFFYDRLGLGRSQRPDPIQEVQTPLHLSIAHALVQLLRSGGVAGQNFTKIVGVGHSYGSAQLGGIATFWPSDFDALVLTGATADAIGLQYDNAATNAAIASEAFPSRFAGVSNGYYICPTSEGLQYLFLRFPTFAPKLRDLAFEMGQTQSVGELLGSIELSAPTNFTGPVYVINGQRDMQNCLGNCYIPYDKTAALQPALFPHARKDSSYYVVPDTGHGINYHYTAADAFGKISTWLSDVGF